jgi:hypothetical protein
VTMWADQRSIEIRYNAGTFRCIPGIVVDPSSAPFSHWSKAGLWIRASNTDVTVSLPKEWQDKARIVWGAPGTPATAVRFGPCPSKVATWDGYSGGFLLRAKSACLPLISAVGDSRTTLRFGWTINDCGSKPGQVDVVLDLDDDRRIALEESSEVRADIHAARNAIRKRQAKHHFAGASLSGLWHVTVRVETRVNAIRPADLEEALRQFEQDGLQVVDADPWGEAASSRLAKLGVVSATLWNPTPPPGRARIIVSSAWDSIGTTESLPNALTSGRNDAVHEGRDFVNDLEVDRLLDLLRHALVRLALHLDTSHRASGRSCRTYRQAMRCSAP